MSSLVPAEQFDLPLPRKVDRLYVVDDAGVLAALGAEGHARWVLPADAHGFCRLHRARLASVRVWLEGACVPDGGVVDVRMVTEGSFLDRVGGTSYRFTSEPLDRTFRYRVSRSDDGSPAWVFPEGTYGHVVVDGVVDESLSYASVQPRAFAEWRVTVSGDALDLSGLTRVVMEFAGSVSPQT